MILKYFDEDAKTEPKMYNPGPTFEIDTIQKPEFTTFSPIYANTGCIEHTVNNTRTIKYMALTEKGHFYRPDVGIYNGHRVGFLITEIFICTNNLRTGFFGDSTKPGWTCMYLGDKPTEDNCKQLTDNEFGNQVLWGLMKEISYHELVKNPREEKEYHEYIHGKLPDGFNPFQIVLDNVYY